MFVLPLFGRATSNLLEHYDDIGILVKLKSGLEVDVAGLTLFEIKHEVNNLFNREVNVVTLTMQDFLFCKHSFDHSKLVISVSHTK